MCSELTEQTDQTERSCRGAVMIQSNMMEKFGIYFDEVGLNKTYGRMFGFFMTTPEPVSMKKLVEELQISKSTASTELRRLLSMGVIEKVLLLDKRADFYRLKKNIWIVHLHQKIQEVKKLRSIIEEIPMRDLETMKHLKEMADYCTFLEGELKILVEKYARSASEKAFGTYIEKGVGDKKLIVEWCRLSALSDEFSEKMSLLSNLGIESFKDIEIAFLKSHPRAMEEDKNLAAFSGLDNHELEGAMKDKLQKIFLTQPKELSAEMRTVMSDIYYYLVTIRDETSEKVQGFITFMSGGSIPKNEFKITILAIDGSVRRTGLAGCLMNSLNKIGVECKKLFASTRPSNTVAIKAYKKWGFAEDIEALKSSPSHFVTGHWVHLARK